MNTPVERMGIRTLKQHVSAVMRRVAAGDTIEVTDHGHAVARLVPVRAGELEQLVADGLATRARVDLLDALDEIGRRGPEPDGR